MNFQQEDQDDMSSILRVQWTVAPKIAPRPRIVCNGCRTIKPFRCSGKIRLNARGKRLDAWLIYKCMSCDNTWNHPIFERRALRGIDPVLLRALQSNDETLAKSIAFDMGPLRSKTDRIDEFADVDVLKQILLEETKPW